MSDTDYQGGMVTPELSDVSSIITDRYGISTGSATFKVRTVNAEAYIGWGGNHPHADWMKRERTILNFKPGFAEIVVEYVGIPNQYTDPVVDYIDTASQEPIATHPKFTSDLAGTPDNPLNNAYFDPDSGAFDHFGSGTELTGVVDYLSGQVTRRVTICGCRDPEFLQDSVGQVGVGSYGDAMARATELFIGFNGEQRGDIFRVALDFRQPGLRGWSTLVYQK